MTNRNQALPKRTTIAFDLAHILDENPRLKHQLDRSRAPYPTALIQDIANSTVPVPGQSRRKDYQIVLDAPNKDYEKLVVDAINIGFYPSRGIADAAYQFFHGVVSSLMTFEEAAYEIVDLRGVRCDLPPIRLVGVPQGSLARTQGLLIQEVPIAVARQLGVSERFAVDSNAIVFFQLPKYIRTEFSHMMEALAELSDPILPATALAAFPGGGSHIGFDWARFSRTKDVALAKTTRLIGWTPGSFELREGKATEHYFWHRQLALERFKVELRAEMLNAFNVGLDHIGRLVGAELGLRIEGLPTTDEIENARRHLLDGSRSLAEIHEVFRIY